MTNWKLVDFNEELGEIAAHAHGCGPQRVTVNGKVDVVVLSPAEYSRLMGEAPSATDTDAQSDPDEAERVLSEAAQATPRPEDHPDRKWIWEWDEETQRWALPWAKDADPAEHPGLEFLNFMQNSPLAQAFRDGDFTPEEWDAACRIGR